MQKKNYFNTEDLKDFQRINELNRTLGEKFFEYYGEVFKEGALSEREKALIALAVAHAVQCPYCMDAYTTECLEKGADDEQMMEAVHVAAAIKSGATLVNSVAMLKDLEQLQQ